MVKRFRIAAFIFILFSLIAVSCFGSMMPERNVPDAYFSSPLLPQQVFIIVVRLSAVERGYVRVEWAVFVRTIFLRDGCSDGSSWYTYCSGDPINSVDLWGLCSEENKMYFCAAAPRAPQWWQDFDATVTRGAARLANIFGAGYGPNANLPVLESWWNQKFGNGTIYTVPMTPYGYWPASDKLADQTITLATVAFAETSLLRGTTALAAGSGEAGLYNFGKTAAEHMQNPARQVPIQILDDVIKNTKGLPDPEGSNALMHYSTISKNEKLYNLEVLHDEATNSIWHFEYTTKAIGPLPAIK
jgi:hypothetical protein